MFPTVVGPRFNNPNNQGTGSQTSAAWAAQPYLSKGQDSPAAFDIHVTINTPIGVKEVRSSSHDISTASEQGGTLIVGLKPGAEPVNNRDFILDYRLAGDKIESGVMLYKGQDENFFLAMVEPPKALPYQHRPRVTTSLWSTSLAPCIRFPLDTAKALLLRADRRPAPE